jgi:two-component system response regulator
MPGLILLDLNMPRMDGRTALKHIKADPELRRIPVIVLTTSKAEEDILRTYDLGVSSFITKPVSFEGLVDVVRTLNHYWIEIVELPASEAA